MRALEDLGPKNQHLTAILRLIMSREQVNGPDDGKSISTSGWQASVSRQSGRCRSAHNSSRVSGCLGSWYDWSSCYHHSDLWGVSTEKRKKDCFATKEICFFHMSLSQLFCNAIYKTQHFAL